MINVEYIMDDDKSLLTIMFNNAVLRHMKAKCDDYLNFFQAEYRINFITIFKADTGYRITRVPRVKKMYQIQVRHKLIGIKEFQSIPCTYYMKKNGFIRFVIDTREKMIMLKKLQSKS